jgi:hypothetical protein
MLMEEKESSVMLAKEGWSGEHDFRAFYCDFFMEREDFYDFRDAYYTWQGDDVDEFICAYFRNRDERYAFYAFITFKKWKWEQAAADIDEATLALREVQRCFPAVVPKYKRGPLSEETKAKMSRAKLGVPKDEQTRVNISKGRREWLKKKREGLDPRQT